MKSLTQTLRSWLPIAAFAAAHSYGQVWTGMEPDVTLSWQSGGIVQIDEVDHGVANELLAQAGAITLNVSAPQEHPDLLAFQGFDRVRVDPTTDTAVFSAPHVIVSGTLVISEVPPNPSVGQAYPIIAASLIEGTFSGFDLPEVSHLGLQWETSELPVWGLIRLVSSSIFVDVEIRSDPTGMVQALRTLPLGSRFQPDLPPIVSGGQHFSFWTFDGIRQSDPRGRSYFRPSIVLTEPLTAIAHYFEASLDGDGDRLPDWWEFWMFGSRAEGPQDDFDGDGWTNEEEFRLGFDATSVDELVSGGLSMRFSEPQMYRDQGLFFYELVSVPLGLRADRGHILEGQTYASPHVNEEVSGYRFVGWWINGERQADANGHFRRQISFLPAEDFLIEAHYVAVGDDQNENGIPDWKEWQYFGGLIDATSDPSEDGFTVSEALAYGFSPATTNEVRSGGLSLRFSPPAVFAEGKVLYTLESRPLGLLSGVQEWRDLGSEATLPTQGTGDVTGNRFAYWSVNGVRLADPAGISRRGGILSLDTDTHVIGHFFPSGEDADEDGLPDFEEYRFWGTLDFGPEDDPDGDGFTIGFERDFGFSLATTDELHSGGLSMRFSAPAVHVQGGWYPVTVESVPYGLLQRTVTWYEEGTTFTSTHLQTSENRNGYRFGYWLLNGVRVADPAGIARNQVQHEVNEPVSLIAVFVFDGMDSAGDGVPDFWALRFSQIDEMLSGSEDPDEDGFSTIDEFRLGFSPTVRDELVSGGISLRFSSPASFDLQLPASGYSLWLRTFFSDEEIATNPRLGYAEDFSGDGLMNLLSYLYGMDPRSPMDPLFRSLLPLVETTVEGRVRISYEYPQALPTDARLALQISHDLRNWFPVRHEAFSFSIWENDFVEWHVWESEGAHPGEVFFRMRYDLD